MGRAKRDNTHEELVIGGNGDTTSEGSDGGNWMRRIKNTGKSLGFKKKPEEPFQGIDSQEVMSVFPQCEYCEYSVLSEVYLLSLEMRIYLIFIFQNHFRHCV